MFARAISQLSAVIDHRPTRRFRRIALALTAAIFAVSASACSSTPESVSMSSIQPQPASDQSSGAGPEAQPPGPPLSKADSEAMGVWGGTSLASCNLMTRPNRCNAQQKITITLVQSKSGLGGYYACAYGTQNCFNMNVSGKIARVDLNGSRLTILVQMRDGSSCRYTGMRKQGDINGGYTCTQGGTPIENGVWRARHEY